MKAGERPSTTSRSRLGLTLIILLMVISSPMVILFTPQYLLANSRVTDTSSSHSTLPMSEHHSSPSASSPASTPTIQAPLQIPRTLQSNDLVNSLAFYEVTFITSTTGAIDRIRMDFPAGTEIAAAGVIERVGIGGGTLLKSGNSITFDVTTPVSIPAGTFIRLEMFGIKNPTNPGTSFTATITTRDSGGNLIDGPSQTNVYTIKQIGTSDLADNAVTAPKIADSSISSTKPAESFMKRVTLLDNMAGNALGWNPDGVDRLFMIAEPEISGIDNSFFTIEITSGLGSPLSARQGCEVDGHSETTKIFEIVCENAPPVGAELHYVVGHLPGHVA